MAPLQVGDSFPEGVNFSYIAPTPETREIIACGVPIGYNASEDFKNKKVVLVAVPGAFTPLCQGKHVVSYTENIDRLKAKGVDEVVIISVNDAFVMSAWGKANGILDEYIRFMSDGDNAFSRSIGWVNDQRQRPQRYAVIIDHGKVVYADLDVQGSIEKSGAEAVLSKL